MVSHDCCSVIKPVEALAVHVADGTYLILYLPHCRTIRIWQSGECTATLKDHQGPVQCLLLLPNGDFLSGSNDMTIKLWSKAKCVHTFPGHTDTVRQVTS